MKFSLRTLLLSFTVIAIATAAFAMLYNRYLQINQLFDDPFGAKKRGFHVVDGVPTYLDGNASNPHIKIPFPEADDRTFLPFEQPKDAKVRFAVDTNGVYMATLYRAFRLNKADAATFKLLTPDGLYACDATNVYYWGIKISRAVPLTFEVLDYPFGKDAEQAYIGPVPIHVADIDTWQPLEQGSHGFPWYRSGNVNRPLNVDKMAWRGWSRDSSRVYYGNKVVPKADAETFEVLRMKYSKDENTVFYYDKIVADADPTSFVAHDGPYIPGTKLPLGSGVDAHDKNHEYSCGKFFKRK